jgi:hypothetical protein
MGEININRILTQIRNSIFEVMGEAGQKDLSDGIKLTWNPCSDSKYRDSKYRYVNLHGPGLHKSFIFDTEECEVVEEK